MAPSRASKPKPVEVDKEKRRIVDIGAERVTNTTDTEFPGHFAGEDNAWDLEEFKRVEIHYSEPHDLSFSLIRVQAPIANALRRILIANIPTFAIETVWIQNNTSVIQDEVLSHRLGLIPLAVPAPMLSRMRYPPQSQYEGQQESRGTYTDHDTLMLKLDISCSRNEGAEADETDPKELYHNAHVYAKDLVYVPQGSQKKWSSEAGGELVRAVNPDILVAKMRHGQVIQLEAFAVKGIGADHAKFSPVATATYRLMPKIDITRPILGDDAEKFASCFPPGVIEVGTVSDEEASRDGSGYEGQAGEKKALVVAPFKDTVSRECLRHDEFKDKVKLGRVRDHFIFSVESTGQYESDWLFIEAIRELKAKCKDLKEDVISLAQ